MTIHAITGTTNGISSCTMQSVDNEPNAILYVTHGDSEVLAALNLCRKLVEAGYDPQTPISIPVLPGVKILERAT
ncbi:MAG: hypothetical protein WBO12_02300 [Xanthobacteraceae bacterium]|jgi:hypothetical protein